MTSGFTITAPKLVHGSKSRKIHVKTSNAQSRHYARKASGVTRVDGALIVHQVTNLIAVEGVINSDKQIGSHSHDFSSFT